MTDALDHFLRRIRNFPVFLILISAVATARADSSPSLSQSMPAGALAFVELHDLGNVVERVRRSSYLEELTSSPQFVEMAASPQYRKAQAARQIAEVQLGMDLWSAVKILLGERVGVAIYPKDDGEQPAVLAMIRVADAKSLAELRGRIEPFLVLGEDQIEQSAIGDIKVFTIAGVASFSFHDGWFLAANDRTLFENSIKLVLDGEGPSLSQDAALVAMHRQMGSDHLLSAYLNTGMLSQATGGRFAPEKLDNPLASLLVGGIIELAVGSPYAGLTLDVGEKNFALTAGIEGKTTELGETHRSFFSDPDGPGTPAIPAVPSVIGGFTFYRNFAEWYRQRESLMLPEVLPGFDKFETGLSNLLPGKDFGEDVLPLVGNSLTFVAAPQDYDHLEGSPGVKLPGFGLVFELAQPQEAADVFQLFFQTLTSILNIQAGQQGREPMVMTSESYNEVQISYGRFLKKPVGDRLPIVFNFMPASALVGDKFIVTSSVGLCRQLVDTLRQPPEEAKRPNRNLNLEFHIGPFADIIEANRELLQARSIQGGKTVEQAKSDFDAAMRILQSLDLLRFSTSVKSDSFQTTLEGSWK